MPLGFPRTGVALTTQADHWLSFTCTRKASCSGWNFAWAWTCSDSYFLCLTNQQCRWLLFSNCLQMGSEAVLAAFFDFTVPLAPLNREGILKVRGRWFLPSTDIPPCQTAKSLVFNLGVMAPSKGLKADFQGVTESSAPWFMEGGSGWFWPLKHSMTQDQSTLGTVPSKCNPTSGVALALGWWQGVGIGPLKT